MNKTNASFVYVLESSNLWHGRLGHVNYGSLKRLINLNHIPTFQIDIKHVTPQKYSRIFIIILLYIFRV